jgi:hypothetical protein
VNAGTNEVPGLLVAGGVVVLSGEAARATAEAMLIAVRSRRVNGVPRSRTYDILAAALVAAAGHVDVRTEPQIAELSVRHPSVSVEDAAPRLGLSERQTRRLAPKLGGQKIGGRWFLDDQAIREHIEGSHRG